MGIKALDYPDYETRTDEELMQNIQEGDETALHYLMERKAIKLHAYATRFLNNRELAKDVVQEAFIKLWMKRKSYNPKWTLNTWLYRIVTNLSIDYLRAQKAEKNTKQVFFRLITRVSPGQESSDMLEAEEVEAILRHLSKFLSPRQRAIFLLHELEEVSTPDIARILGCKPVTVRNHLFHARKIIQEKLRHYYPEYTP